MMHGAVVSRNIWTFVPDVFLQSPHKFAIEFSGHRLSWWNKSLTQDVFSALTVSGHFFEIVVPSSVPGIWSLPLGRRLLRLMLIWYSNN
jgi:hypothetical protein